MFVPADSLRRFVAIAAVVLLACGDSPADPGPDSPDSPDPPAALPVHLSYASVRTPLATASGLNNRGHVLGYMRGGLWIWQGGPLVFVGRWSVAVDLNDAGEALVQTPFSTLSTYQADPHVVRDGVATSVFFWGVATDLSEDGRVVGWHNAGHNIFQWRRGFIWEGGSLSYIFHADTTREYPAKNTFAWAVNNRREVLVSMRDEPAGAAPATHYYIWRDGAFTLLPQPAPGCTSWTGVTLNDSGAVLVNCPGSAWLWNGSGYTSLAPITSGIDMNERSEVLGTGGAETYVWRGGSATRLLGSGPFTPRRINDAGQVLVNVGGARPAAYLLTPNAGGR